MTNDKPHLLNRTYQAEKSVRTNTTQGSDEAAFGNQRYRCL